MRRKHLGLAALVALVGALAFLAAGCGGGGARAHPARTGRSQGLGSTLDEIQAKAKDEGQTNLVIWADYAHKSWADDFTKQTGCKVITKDGASSDDMVDLMATGAYDGVSASGDATSRLIARGDVAPVNFDLTPNYADVFEGLKNTSYNSVDGVGYGVPHGRGPNVLVFRNDILPANTNSWAPIWDGSQAGKLSIFNGQAFIADAAVYLKATQPDLNITNPYELDEDQFTAVVDLLKKQKGEHRQVLGRRHVRRPGDDVQVGRDDRRHDVAVPGRPHGSGEAAAQGDGAQAEGRHDGLVGHVDDLQDGRASELHVPLDELHHLAGGEREGRRVVRRGTVEREGVRPDHRPEPLHDVPRTDEAWWKDVYYWDTPKSDCGDDRGEVCKTYEDWRAAWTEIKG